jgi:hypothetical protein
VLLTLLFCTLTCLLSLPQKSSSEMGSLSSVATLHSIPTSQIPQLIKITQSQRLKLSAIQETAVRGSLRPQYSFQKSLDASQFFFFNFIIFYQVLFM